MKLRVDSPPHESLCLRMDSQYRASASFGLTESLSVQSPEICKDWQIPLSEFVVNGLGQGQIRTPCLIWADAPCGVSFSEAHMRVDTQSEVLDDMTIYQGHIDRLRGEFVRFYCAEATVDDCEIAHISCFDRTFIGLSMILPSSGPRVGPNSLVQ